MPGAVQIRAEHLCLWGPESACRERGNGALQERWGQTAGEARRGPGDVAGGNAVGFWEI